ncbi:hypothetical protein PTSG_09500 [Salpingoeca rosetta]|uniref:TLC domain-containing protein n=1 Tax=Salpingoeca rosetta (strain ATCC 50818 / BSB-021) TaxID=946362 RepID=F2UL67_SALR5|nr:uncharacterized protein PTSG_09500 [Salpingoeca rosetta]EGD77866.1 hypothetical protein PTSG_09500 [Salpingoeca rosetta]|eukprot:XP_004989930.1 hypothetical protein PTSG_09500 [Salpingoeca rosetta]
MNWQYDLAVAAVSFVVFYLLDELIVKTGFFPKSDKNGRYFTLHVVCNLVVTLVHVDDLLFTYMHPMEAAFVECDCFGTDVMFALHVYHMVAFLPLAYVDWLHHIIMIGITLPMSYIVQPGSLLGHGTFYATGLPGGIDYAMLVAVKKGWMKSVTEKRYNSNIQQWIRSPGCVIDAFLVWISWVEYCRRADAGMSPITPNTSLYNTAPRWVIFVITFFNLATIFWNGPYFSKRVIESHTRHALRDKLRRELEEELAAGGGAARSTTTGKQTSTAAPAGKKPANGTAAAGAAAPGARRRAKAD